MRYDTPIYFQKRTEGKYNTETGDYDDDSVEEKEIYGAVSNTSMEMMNIVYGQINQTSLTVHLQNHYEDSFDSIRINQKVYKVDNRTKYKVKESLVLSEVK